jgi:hypothetical protein
MSKIKLGKRPDTFKPFSVSFTLPDGSEGKIEATFRYRTRREFGAMLDDLFGSPGKELPQRTEADGAPKLTDYEALFARTSEANARHLLTALAGWSLEEPLTEESLQSLCDELPAAAAALMAGYSTACQEGRLGN